MWVPAGGAELVATLQLPDTMFPCRTQFIRYTGCFGTSVNTVLNKWAHKRGLLKFYMLHCHI